MSFLKIKDPATRDAIVKEYLELQKNIRDNLLSERTRELELQTDLSKFYRPITKTQKATTREITEGPKPIRERIEKLPQSITFPTTQPLGEASGQEKLFEKLLESFEEEKEEEEEEEKEELARLFLNRPNPDTNFGIRKEKGRYYIGNKPIRIVNNDIILDDELILGKAGLWELLTSKNPQNYDKAEDYAKYRYLMLKTNAIHKENDPNSRRAKDNYKGDKWENILNPIWNEIMKNMDEKEYEGKGVVVIPSDPNAFLERLDLLFASQEAGHTGVGNELVNICDELKRQGVLDTKAYKN